MTPDSTDIRHAEFCRQIENRHILQQAYAKGTEEGIKATWTAEQHANYNAQQGLGIFGLPIIFGIAGLNIVWDYVFAHWVAWFPGGDIAAKAVAWAAIVVVVWGLWPVIRWYFQFLDGVSKRVCGRR